MKATGMPEKDESNTSSKLLQSRGSMSKLYSLGVLSAFLTGGSVIIGYNRSYEEAVHYAMFGPFFTVFVMTLLHNTIRLCHLPEELKHIPGRYHNYKAALKAVFCCNSYTAVSYATSTVVTLGSWYKGENPFEYLLSFGALPVLLIFAVGFLFSHIINMEESPLQNSLLIENLDYLDIGSGMALCFFCGYLQIVLPDNGENTKGIRNKIRTYININHLNDESFPVKKLFILIPKNLTVPSMLSDISENMEAAGSLKEEIRNRFGVGSRIYKNSVYKIKTEKDLIYLVVEGASPLKTYEEILRDQRIREKFQHLRDEIVFAFYTTLKRIIEENNYSDLCELVYYNDQDERGRKVDVARILVERIKELKDRNSYEGD